MEEFLLLHSGPITLFEGCMNSVELLTKTKDLLSKVCILTFILNCINTYIKWIKFIPHECPVSHEAVYTTQS